MTSVIRGEDTSLSIEMAIDILRPLIGTSGACFDDIARRSYHSTYKVKECVDHLVSKEMLDIKYYIDKKISPLEIYYIITVRGIRFVKLYDEIMENVDGFSEEESIL